MNKHCFILRTGNKIIVTPPRLSVAGLTQRQNTKNRQSKSAPVARNYANNRKVSTMPSSRTRQLCLHTVTWFCLIPPTYLLRNLETIVSVRSSCKKPLNCLAALQAVHKALHSMRGVVYKYCKHIHKKDGYSYAT